MRDRGRIALLQSSLFERGGESACSRWLHRPSLDGNSCVPDSLACRRARCSRRAAPGPWHCSEMSFHHSHLYCSFWHPVPNEALPNLPAHNQLLGEILQQRGWERSCRRYLEYQTPARPEKCLEPI